MSVVLDGEPVKIFQGKMDALGDTDDGKTITLSLAAESELIDLQRTREIRYTDENQKSLFPGDQGLEFVTSIQNKQIDINFADEGNSGSSGGGGGSGSQSETGLSHGSR